MEGAREQQVAPQAERQRPPSASQKQQRAADLGEQRHRSSSHPGSSRGDSRGDGAGSHRAVVDSSTVQQQGVVAAGGVAVGGSSIKADQTSMQPSVPAPAAAAAHDRWQLEEGVPEAAAEVAGAGGAGGTGEHESDRWQLDDGELNDADINSWLDSLFAVAAAGAT